MPQEQTVIYTARTLQDAYLLKNLLAEQRIEAIVLGDALKGGSGGAEAGWETSTRVAVAEDDAPRARQIARKFDGQAASAAASPTAEGPGPEEPATVLDEWPRCPECDSPRSTRCQICGTAGTDFLPADMGFVWIPEADDIAYRPACGSCGPGGCTPAVAGEEAPEADDQADGESPAALLMCPTCDEPFIPQYPRVCEWCGHEFSGGVEFELPPPPVEQINSRVIAVIVGLLAFVVAMVVYLALIAY